MIFREVVDYFLGGKCSVEVQNLNVYISLYRMSQFHRRKSGLIFKLDFKETVSLNKIDFGLSRVKVIQAIKNGYTFLTYQMIRLIKCHRSFILFLKSLASLILFTLSLLLIFNYMWMYALYKKKFIKLFMLYWKSS